ncbi:MAG: hypothetical protein LBC74_03595 [Planctomycetaceae bacterium]|nr:hypothetical protein [Planctomycetaceae bacterium]
MTPPRPPLTPPKEGNIRLRRRHLFIRLTRRLILIPLLRRGRGGLLKHNRIITTL